MGSDLESQPSPANTPIFLPSTAVLLPGPAVNPVRNAQSPIRKKHYIYGRERWSLSIRAVPKNFLLCQGNPDNDPCRDMRERWVASAKMTLIRGRGAILSAEDI